MFVYKATNKISGKCYIGKTTKSLDERKSQHLKLSKTKNTHFLNALRSYGESNFTWEIIDTAKTNEELNEKEIYWINQYNSVNNGYNMIDGGTGGYNIYAVNANREKRKGKTWEDIYGKEQSLNLKEKARKRINEHNKIFGFDNINKERSKQYAKKGAYVRHNMGYTHSEETRKKIGIAKTGQKHSKETRNTISQQTKKAMKSVDWDILMEKALDSRKKYWSKKHKSDREKIKKMRSEKIKISEQCKMLKISLPTYYKRLQEIKKYG